MKEFSKYVGLDTHADTIAVSVAEACGGKPRYYGEIANRPASVARLVKKLSGDGEVMSFCYEAGPCGYGLYRQITDLGHACDVVAPSLIPTKPGDRVKTDRRDANQLSRLQRAGELTPVWVPGPEQEERACSRIFAVPRCLPVQGSPSLANLFSGAIPSLRNPAPRSGTRPSLDYS